MAGVFLLDFFNPDRLLRNPVVWFGAAFQLWMLVDAFRREEWIWFVFILLFSVLTAALYFFLVYIPAAPASRPRFEIPGRADRQKIRELEAQIHHLDKPHHHLELGNIFLKQGKLDRAEDCYRQALERDPQEIDAQVGLGSALRQQKRFAEALAVLENVVTADPRHGYGATLMDYAEALAALDRKDDAIKAWSRVLENHAYARARVSLAELYLKIGNPTAARKELEETLVDYQHSPPFQQAQERVWIRRAKSLLKKLP